MPASAAAVAGYVAAEVESRQQLAPGHLGCDPATVQAATVAAGLIEHQRPESLAGVESILANVASTARRPGAGIARALIKVITLSHVFPTYTPPETLLRLLEAGFPPVLAWPNGEGPPTLPGT